MKYILFIFLLVSCGPVKEKAFVYKGESGKNGSSLVSIVRNASTPFECEESGSRLDIYLDFNNNLIAEENIDIYLNSVVVCNGKSGLQGLQGLNGQNGLSAYELAVLNGFNGTIEEWLNSLVGSPGPQGLQGEIGPQGEKGEQGPPGRDGIDGKNATATITAFTFDHCVEIGTTNKYTKPNSSNTSAIYSLPGCPSSSKLFQLNMGDSYWVTPTTLAIKSETIGIRVIFFNE